VNKRERERIHKRLDRVLDADDAAAEAEKAIVKHERSACAGCEERPWGCKEWEKLESDYMTAEDKSDRLVRDFTGVLSRVTWG
jgi:hypothetical protein